MNDYPQRFTVLVENYIALRRSLGYAFQKQAATLGVLRQYVEGNNFAGPLTQEMALQFVLSTGADRTGNYRACRYAVVRRFAEYLAVHDPQTEVLDPRVFPRSRAIPPPRILNNQEMQSLIAAARKISPCRPQRGHTLASLVGLLASTGLRSGEALRLDRGDVDLTEGVLQVRKTKFRKDRLVPVHVTTLNELRTYAQARDSAFPKPLSQAFFVSLRGSRLSKAALYTSFHEACVLASIGENPCVLRPHDLRHRFAVTRLAEWRRQNVDVQALLPVLATYLGHARYSDTAYYITGTAELLGLAAQHAFGVEGGQS
jgi:integrase